MGMGGRKITVTIKGGEKVIKNAQEALDRWKKALRSAVYAEASNVMTISKRLVPVDSGTLKGSGYVTLPEHRGPQILCELGYGGPAKKYAEIQHESLHYRHPRGGQAKYLSVAVGKREGDLKNSISKLAKAAFEANDDASRNPQMPVHPDETGPLGRKRQRST